MTDLCAIGQTMFAASDRTETQFLEGERIAFVGKLAGMSKRDAKKLVRQHAAIPRDRPDPSVSMIVVGEEDHLPVGDLSEVEEFFDTATREAFDRGDIRVVTETELWQHIGLVEAEQNIHRLHTPAMLASLLGIPVAIIRRWHRKKVIVPVREVRRLPYFDFQEVATARRLADLLAAGCSPKTIEKKLADLAKYLPGVERPLAQLSVIVEGKQLLLRESSGLTEPSGQLRFDFDSTDGMDAAVLDEAQGSATRIMSLASRAATMSPTATPDEMVLLAAELDEEGQLESAAEMYRATLAAAGPNAEVNFLLAELLYRKGDLGGARERYYSAIELDEDYVEARANLGCVLAEVGEYELAVAAFQGALAYHDDYPDAHYHLARTLDTLQRSDEAEPHWQSFIDLVPESPWAVEARDRLERSRDT